MTKVSAIGKFRLFGGDASKQRAQEFADSRGLEVRELGTSGALFETWGLDPWGYDDNGTRYSYVVINPDKYPK